MSTGVASSSLRTRLLRPVLAGVALLWLLAAVLAWADTRRELDDLLDGRFAPENRMLLAAEVTRVG